MCDVLAVAAAAAVVGAAVAAAAVEDNKDLDPVAGKELIDKKSQMMQVKQEQGQLGLDTHMPHRSHGDRLRPEDDPGRDVRSTLLEVQVGEEQAGKTRPNGDVLDSLYLEYGEAVGGLDHRRRGHLDMAPEAASDSHEAADN